jgi:hypothetical protein
MTLLVSDYHERLPSDVADFTLESHGPHHVVLQPRTVRADDYLSDHVSYDPDGASWCGGGYAVARAELPNVLSDLEAFDLVVEGV